MQVSLDIIYQSHNSNTPLLVQVIWMDKTYLWSMLLEKSGHAFHLSQLNRRKTVSNSAEVPYFTSPLKWKPVKTNMSCFCFHVLLVPVWDMFINLFWISFLVIQCLCIIWGTNISIEPWWIGIWLNMLPSIKHDNRLGLQNTPVVSLQRGKSPNKCPRYEINPPDREVPVMLKLGGIWSILSLLLLSGPLRPSVVATNKVLSMGQIELFDI